MYKRIIIVTLLLAALSFIGSSAAVAGAQYKRSADFQYKYEGDLLPSDAATSPRWERGFSGGIAYETYYCDVSGSILTLDTVKNPSPTEAAWYALPGEYSDYANEFYPFPGASNPWDVKMDAGYTVEMRFKMDGIQIPNDSNYPIGKFAFWLDLQEGLHGQWNTVQIFPDKIAAVNSSTPDILYSGDLTNKFYVLRVVRNPGAVEVIRNVYDFYLDNALIATKVASPINAAYNQDALLFGDAAGASGGTDIKIEIDYLRIDLTGAYKPLYLKPDINDDMITNFNDFAKLAQVWMLSTDITVVGHVDCTNPSNADVCQ